jgi:hypothetical protein
MCIAVTVYLVVLLKSEISTSCSCFFYFWLCSAAFCLRRFWNSHNIPDECWSLLTRCLVPPRKQWHLDYTAIETSVTACQFTERYLSEDLNFHILVLSLSHRYNQTYLDSLPENRPLHQNSYPPDCHWSSTPTRTPRGIPPARAAPHLQDPTTYNAFMYVFINLRWWDLNI